MNLGELWIAHPLFPWIMGILAWWVMCSTIVMARSWTRIKKLEEQISCIENEEKEIANLCENKEHPAETAVLSHV